MKIYTEEFKRAAVARYPKETWAAIGREIDVTPTLIREWAAKIKAGKPLNPPRQQFSNEDKAAAVKRVEKGEERAKVTKDMKITSGMMSDWIRKFGTDSKVKLKSHAKSAKGMDYKKMDVDGKATIRAQACALVDSGMSVEQAANELKPYKVRTSAIYYWINHRGTMDGDTSGKVVAPKKSNGNGGGANRNIMHAIGLLRGIRSKLNINNPVDVTVATVLHILEGKM